ncbi:MAG TPA: HAMP domain-containing sensor histidine kinase [Arenimonas sp.]|nr:HAMP domain-containing sensor histidine kinase [Arenimonas sp.]
MAARPSLQWQLAASLIAYALLLSTALFVHGMLVNERAERMMWESLLNVEMDHLLLRREQDPDYRWSEVGAVRLFVEADTAPLPTFLRDLGPGLHDNQYFDNNQWVVLVREVEGDRLMLALDIDGFDQHEWELAQPILYSSVALVLLLSLAIAFGARLASRPLQQTAQRIGKLQPDASGQRIEMPARASAELAVVVDALNDFLARNERFVERERAFIDSASHELRTPVAVIAGATELALSQSPSGSASRAQLLRILRTARGVEQLISLLLVLAKDPDRLATVSDRFDIAELLPDIVADHVHLCRDKDLRVVLGPVASCELQAPVAIVQAAIGNLLRNAIENSDRGEIHIACDEQLQVSIEDPGHGMTPEEISVIYARMARGGGRESGIGLELIGRLCEHLGWRLDIRSLPSQGTRVTLDLSGVRAAPA